MKFSLILIGLAVLVVVNARSMYQDEGDNENGSSPSLDGPSGNGDDFGGFQNFQQGDEEAGPLDDEEGPSRIGFDGGMPSFQKDGPPQHGSSEEGPSSSENDGNNGSQGSNHGGWGGFHHGEGSGSGDAQPIDGPSDEPEY